MRVCVLTNGYPRYNSDIIQPFIEMTSESIQKQGVDVAVFTPFHVQFDRKPEDHNVELIPYKYIYPDRYHILGYSNTLVNDTELKKFAYFLGPLMVISAINSIVRCHKRKRFDLIHAHWLLPNGFIGALLSKMLDIPLVISFRGSGVFISQKNYLFRQLTKFTIDTANAVTSNNPESTEFMVQNKAIDKFTVIPNGVDSASFVEFRMESVKVLRKKYNIKNGEIVLFALGRLVYKKGFDYLLRALSEILAAQKKIKLIIGGTGSQYHELLSLARALGVEDNVIFAGEISRNDIPNYFALCDIFVMPSIHDHKGNVDGLPNVVLEAMAASRPVVATNIAGIPLVIRNKIDGILVEEMNSTALAAAIIDLIKSKVIREKLAASAYNRVRGELTWDNIAKRFIEVYHKAINQYLETSG